MTNESATQDKAFFPKYAADGKPTQKTIEHIITGDHPDVLVEVAQKTAKSLAGGRLTTTQFRAIFGVLRSIHGEWNSNTSSTYPIRQLQLLKPRLAYQAARHKKKGLIILRDVLSSSINLVGKDLERMQRLMDFTEAMLAYTIAEDYEQQQSRNKQNKSKRKK